MYTRRAFLASTTAFAASPALAQLSLTGAGGAGSPNVYNWNPAVNLTHYRAKRAQVLAGTARGTLAFYGDSTTLGWGAGTGGLAYPGAHDLGYPAIIASDLAGVGIPTSIESQLGGFGGGLSTVAIMKSYNPRISTTGSGWVPITQSAAVATAGDVFVDNQTTTADLLSFTPTVPVDTFKVYYYKNTTLGSFSWNVDGGADTTVSQTASSAIGVVTISTTLGSHTVNIKRVAGAAFMIGFVAYNSAVSAFDVVNFGWGGSKSGDWNNSSSGFSPIPAIGFYAADLAFINLGINDWNAAVSQATYSANIQALITAQKAVGDCILVSPNQTGDVATQAQQAVYIATLKTLSTSNNVPLIDLWTQDGSYTFRNGLGQMFDTLHPKASLYVIEAGFIFQQLSKA